MSRAENFDQLRRPDDGATAVEIGNPATAEFEVGVPGNTCNGLEAQQPIAALDVLPPKAINAPPGRRCRKRRANHQGCKYDAVGLLS